MTPPASSHLSSEREVFTCLLLCRSGFYIPLLRMSKSVLLNVHSSQLPPEGASSYRLKKSTSGKKELSVKQEHTLLMIISNKLKLMPFKEWLLCAWWELGDITIKNALRQIQTIFWNSPFQSFNHKYNLYLNSQLNLFNLFKVFFILVYKLCLIISLQWIQKIFWARFSQSLSDEFLFLWL